MRCYEFMGERARALEHYEASSEVLLEELGTAPGPETRALYEELRRGEREGESTTAGSHFAAPPPEMSEARPNNLPLQLTPLVGREREVEEISERLRGEKARLLTLTGPGGTGKTRVALAAGAGLLEQFDDGVFFVALAAIQDPELVPSAIAGSLSVKESAEQPLMEAIKGYLRHKRLLLILDNFEQVLQVAPFVRGLVGTCPGLEVLVTSRIPLGALRGAGVPRASPDRT
jgi:hypothetical protein